MKDELMRNPVIPPHYRTGFVTILGRPNVGKSTLLNRILGQKISITSHKPQTTRQQILGVKTTSSAQTIYIDTPGIHTEKLNALNRYMVKEATRTLADVDLCLFVVETPYFSETDESILQLVQRSAIPVILVANKIDNLTDKKELLPYINKVNPKMRFAEVVPISSKTGENIDDLETTIAQYLPHGEPIYPEDTLTDRSERFLAAELIREKLIRRLNQEVPHRLCVVVETFKHYDNVLNIVATIWVEREGQKNIVIGKQGDNLKAVGELARIDMEKMFEKKVFLETWVKVKKNWSDDGVALRQFGLFNQD